MDRVHRLLIVEDDANILTALRTLFAHPFIAVTYAQNGIDAIARARECRPHAIILDVWLPGMDGFEVFRILQRDSELRQTRVIFLSAHAEPGAMALAKDHGAFGWFRKPYRDEKLYAKVLQALELENAGESPAPPPPPSGDALPRPGTLPAPVVAIIDPDPLAGDKVRQAARKALGPDTIVAHHRFAMGALKELALARPVLILVTDGNPDFDARTASRLFQREPELAAVPLAMIDRPIDPVRLADRIRYELAARAGTVG